MTRSRVSEVRGFLVRDLAAATPFAARLVRQFALRESEEWIRATIELAMIESLAAEVGESALMEVARKAARKGAMNDISSEYVGRVLAMTPCDPGALYRWAPGYWAFVTRGIGRMTVDLASTRARLTLKDAPADFARSVMWLTLVKGRLLAGLDLIGWPGQIEIEHGADPIFEARWAPS